MGRAADIGGVHHVGHVVHSMDAATASYRRMGFIVPAPEFPVLPAGPGERPRVLGAGNAHVTFRSNFVELVAMADGAGPGKDAVLVPLEVPAEAASQVADAVAVTTARLAAALARFEGLHVLVLQTPSVDATVARLSADGVPHGGVIRLRRAAGPTGTAAHIAFVELGGTTDRTPEGRLALAEDVPGTGPDHPNGALDLVGPLLCVPDAELADHERRYARLLGRPARADGPSHVFDLDRGEVRLVPESALDAALPGERAPSLPAFVAFTVRVRDLVVTRAVLENGDLPALSTPSGAVFVPAAAALGCAVVFRT